MADFGISGMLRKPCSTHQGDEGISPSWRESSFQQRGSGSLWTFWRWGMCERMNGSLIL